ncbi:MAG: TonB family protein [Marinicella pacifica]
MNVNREQTQRHLAAMFSMLLGSTLVLSTLVIINDSNQLNQNTNQSAHSIIKINKPKPKPQEVVQQPKPKPKPKPRRLSPPTPLLGLNSQLGGIDLGLDSLGIGQLSDLDNDMLNTDGNTVMSEDMVDQVPRATYQAPVNYPARARAKGIEGYVVFSLLIDETGHIEEVRIIDATPEDVFNETALQAIRQWRFEPAKYQGKAVKTWAKQRIRFNLS